MSQPTNPVLTDVDEHLAPTNLSEGQEPQLFGHPKGLLYLFFAELWERFSFYGMRALLVLYMTNVLFEKLAGGTADTIAYAIYGGYGALVYFTPVIGGMIADKFLGYRKAIMIGAILFVLGHFALAIEHPVFFYGALGLLIVGNGLFKPNISSLVGSLYPKGDPRRDNGFTIFYLGINLGAFLAPLVCGYLGREYGYHYGFGAAGIGMLAGLIVFYLGNKGIVFGNKGLPPSSTVLSEKGKFGLSNYALILLATILAVPFFAFLLYVYEANPVTLFGNKMVLDLVGYLQVILLVGILYVIIKTLASVSKVERERLLVVVVLTFLMTIFWSFFELGGSALTLFAERNVDLPSWLGAAETNSINPMFIILFAFPFSFMWAGLSKAKTNPYTPVKFGLGIAQLGLGFLIFALSANYASEAGKVPFLFLWLGYLFITTGELFMSPVGLSKVTELSVTKVVAFMMGVWFLSSSFAHYVAGQIAQLTAVEQSEGVEVSTYDMLISYTDVFQTVAYISIGFAVIALLFTPLIRKWMHGVH